ncbi:esterase/lipase family protein [Rhodopirellula sp. JC639]|uniref:esterase/lipase family protein n=1 Tax=Stieleria mannarensis TaxID=2755585 RepID=UPI0015FFC556|nr:alpha/beta fold hydrolase [Rhodopirellula sp. JC639]
MQTLAIELYDPLRVDAVQVGASQFPIAKDLSAPIVYRLSTRQGGVFEGFLQPFATGPRLGISQARLYTLEPYQPGKIPVVFVHGLLSDRFTWAEMVNELNARPEFVERFQIWVFEYPTGRAFLGSAAELRRQLETVCRRFDPCGRDAQLSNLILAAHSMGGLVAKMQITSSGDLLWRSIADCGFDQVVATPATRQRLSETFFFAPSPRISRVVYFATPHRGSEFAARLIGRIGSACVEEPENEVRMHRMLITANPGVFSREVRRRIPTSLDLLEPQSKLLQVSDRLPIRCGVVTHSIIGDHCWTLSLGRSDGVVSVESARDRNATTERIVDATHSGVKSAPEAVEEFQAILRLHRRHGTGMKPCIQLHSP